MELKLNLIKQHMNIVLELSEIGGRYFFSSKSALQSPFICEECL